MIFYMEGTKGFVLLNTDGKSLDLVGIVKNPTIIKTQTEAYFNFYIHNTRYGKKINYFDYIILDI